MSISTPETAATPQARAGVGIRPAPLWVAAATIIAAAIAALFVSDGLYNIDEFVYLLGAEAFSRTGAFTVENGWDLYQSDDLRIWMLVNGPQGLVPQYPPGISALGGMLYDLLGQRSLILFNALAGAGALCLIFLMARHAYGDTATGYVAATLFLGGTFFVEYMYGLWPHAIGLFTVLAAVYAAMCAAAAEGRKALALSAISGVFIGAALLFRTDSILVLPIIAVFVLLFARHLVPCIIGGTLGLGLGLFPASAINLAKFGAFNPLSYGRSTGSSLDISTFLPAVAALALGLILILALRFTPWTPARRRAAIGASVIGAGGLLLLPEIQSLAGRYLTGLWALGVDLRTVAETNPGVDPEGQPIRMFWTLPKKALVQSLPWLGLLIACLARPATAEARKWHLTWALVAVVWTLPFVFRSWHGGFGSNMRYFVPVLPFLCIPAAHILVRFQQSLRLPPAFIAGAIAFGIFAAVAILLSDPAGEPILAQALSLWIAAAVALLTLLAVALRLEHRGATTAAFLAALFAIGTSFVIGPYGDVKRGQAVRAANASANTAFSSLPAPNLIYGRPELVAQLALRPDWLVAMPDFHSLKPDTALIFAALDGGRRIYADRFYADHIIEAGDGRLETGEEPVPGFVEILPACCAAGDQP